jgi:hypothetical protein
MEKEHTFRILWMILFLHTPLVWATLDAFLAFLALRIDTLVR